MFTSNPISITRCRVYETPALSSPLLSALPLRFNGGDMLSRVLSLMLLGICSAVAAGADTTPLRVGAARVDITPDANAALPMSGYGSRTQGFQKIHDNIYVRALVL